MAATRLIALHINKGKTVVHCLTEQQQSMEAMIPAATSGIFVEWLFTPCPAVCYNVENLRFAFLTTG